jgi:serine protease AprX
MNSGLKFNKFKVLLVALIVLLCNNLIFRLPEVLADNQDTSEVEIIYRESLKLELHELSHTSQEDKSNPNVKQIPDTPKHSIRDINNNKISDPIDKWTADGYEQLDVIVIYDRPLTEEYVNALIELDLEIVDVYWSLEMITLRNVPVNNIVKISEMAGVERVENYGRPVLYSDVATPAVKARESNEYSPNTAWELGYTGIGANIAVVDTGVDNAHPSLSGKWVGGADISKPETFLTPQDGTFDADDTNGHGTTCTGIAMGTGAPDQTYMGAAPGAKVVDVRIGTKIGYAPGEGPLSFYDASLKGIEWVIDHKDDSWQGQDEENNGIDIISLSWGIDVGGASDGSDAYSSLLDRAVDAGVIVSHAAGNSGPNNDGFDGFAAASNGISVASADDQNTIMREDDIIASYSSRGPRHDNGDGNPYNELKPDVTAPGTNIVQVQYDPRGDGSGNGYGNRGSGTSYAAPVVAGIIAMMLEANPDLTPEITREILHLTSERWGEPTIPELDPFWNKDFGYGMVDAYKAVNCSASLEDFDVLDIDLQCYITGIEGISNSNTSNMSIAANQITINGVAFSKQGIEIEKIELAIDEGKWRTIREIEEDGIYSRWNYKLDTREFSNGIHTIKVRSIANEHQSLEHTEKILVINTGQREKKADQSNITVAAGVIIILFATVAAAAYLIDKKRKKH